METTKGSLTNKTPVKKTAWENKILPNKEAIIKSIENGASERQIAAELDMSWSCWLEQKKKHTEIEEWIDVPRARLVGKLKGALVSRALGYEYEEEVTEIKQDLDATGKPVGRQYVYKRKLKQFAPPDTTAIFACLKIYDKDNINYDDKAQMIKIKKEELEIKRKTLLPEDEADTNLIEKIKDLKFEVIDASKKEGNDEDKGNQTNTTL